MLKGLVTIRSMKLEEWLCKKIYYMLDEVSNNSLLIFGLNGWFQIRVIIASIIFIQIPAYGYLFVSSYYFNKEIDLVAVGI